MKFAQPPGWLGDLLPLVIAIVGATLPKAWHSHRDRRGENWPVTYGRILRASVKQEQTETVLKLAYSYRLREETYVGTYQRPVNNDSNVGPLDKILPGTQIPVHYNPVQPWRSQLLEADLHPIVQSLAPTISASSEKVESLPWWKQLWLQFGLMLAVLGFAACLVETISEKMGRPLLSHSAYGLILAAAFPVTLFGLWAGRDQTKRTWRAVPEWMKYMGYVVLFYTALVPLIGNKLPNRRTSPGDRDGTYQLAVYFGAVEVLCGRLRRASQSEDYLQHSLNGGVRIG
jgi:hypothetical protein